MEKCFLFLLSVHLLCLSLPIIPSKSQGFGCGFPGRPFKGKVTPEKNEYDKNEEVTFECNSGYRLKGNSMSRCQGFHNWSGKVPRCQKNAAYKQQVKMGDIYSVHTSSLNHSGITVDGKFTECISMGKIFNKAWWMVKLRQIYSIAAIRIVLRVEKNHRFNVSVDIGESFDVYSTFRSCDTVSEEDEHISQPENGSLLLDRDIYCNNTNGKAKVVRILDLTDLATPSVDAIKICEVEVYVENDKKECPYVDRMPNCKIETENETVFYSPRKGFILTGGTNIRYCKQGEWTGEAPLCIPINLGCELPETTIYETVHPKKKNYYVNENLTFACKEDLDLLIGPKTVECIGNSAWSAYPKCRKNVLKDARIDFFSGMVTNTKKTDNLAADGNEETCQHFNQTVWWTIHLSKQYFIDGVYFLGRFERNLTNRFTDQSGYSITIRADNGISLNDCKNQSDSRLIHLNETFTCSPNVRLSTNTIRILFNFSELFTLILCDIRVFGDVAQNGKLFILDGNSSIHEAGRSSHVKNPFIAAIIAIIVLTGLVVFGIVTLKICKRFATNSMNSVDTYTKENIKTGKSSSEIIDQNIHQHVYEDMNSQRSSPIDYNEELDEAGYLKPKHTSSRNEESSTDCDGYLKPRKNRNFTADFLSGDMRFQSRESLTILEGGDRTNENNVSVFFRLEDDDHNKNRKKYKSAYSLSQESHLSIEDHIYEDINSQSSSPKHNHQELDESALIKKDTISQNNEDPSMDSDGYLKTKSIKEAIYEEI